MTTRAILSLSFVILIFASCRTTYKVQVEIQNATNDTIDLVGVQQAFTINPANQPNSLNDDEIEPGEVFSVEKKFKVKKGESIFFYVKTESTGGLRYAGYHRFDKKTSTYRFPIDKIDTSRAITDANRIQAKLDQVGITDINKTDGPKFEIVTSDISNIMTYLPGLCAVDTNKLDGDLVPSSPLYRSYYRPKQLGIVPAPLVVSGNTIKDNLIIESDGSLSSTFNVPLASNLDLDISNKGFYKVSIEVEDAGWIPVVAENVDSPLEAIFLMDSLGQMTTLIDMYSKIKDQGSWRLFTVEEAFVFNKLTAQTIRYTENNAAFEGNYGSVITTKGGYVRSEQADHVDTRPVTLVYAALTNDVTETARGLLKNILLKDYISVVLSGEESSELENALGVEEVSSLQDQNQSELLESLSEILDLLKEEKKTLNL